MSARRVLLLLLGVLLLSGAAEGLRYVLSRGAADPSTGAGARARLDVDLLAAAEQARVDCETARIDFGSASGRAHYAEPDPRDRSRATGFLSIENEEAHASLAAAIGTRARVRFTAFGRRPRRAVLLGVGIDDGRGPQQVEVRLNGAPEPIAAFELPFARAAERREFALPEHLVADGSNVLEFAFARTVETQYHGEPFRYPVGALFQALEFADSRAAPAAGELAVRAAPGVSGRPARPALLFQEGARVSFALRLPAGAPRFVAAAYVHPDDRAAGRAVQLTIRLRAEPAGGQLLAKGLLDASERAEQRPALEVDADVAAFAGSVVSIELESPPAPPGALPLRVVVAEPSIRGGDAPLRPSRASLPDEGLALQQRLKGMNLLVVLLDAAVARRFTAYGAEQEDAPAAAALARDGIVFEDTTAPASYTLPSVGSLFTGLYPETHGVVDLGDAQVARRLDARVRTLAEHLRGAGYSTLGVVTNPNAGSAFGYGRGFDRYEELFLEPELYREGVLPEALCGRLERALDERPLAEPFFLYAHVFQPHAPYRAPAELALGVVDPAYQGPADGTYSLIHKFKTHEIPDLEPRDFEQMRALYRANLRHGDRGLAMILDALRRRGLLERTVIAIVSDHGEAHGEHGTLEHSDTVFGEQIEVPWILRLPDSAGWKPSRVPGPNSLLDVAPTLLSLLSVDVAGTAFEGQDRTPLLFGGAAAERPLFYRCSGVQPRYGVREFGLSYHLDLRTRGEELFDLRADPAEARSIAAAHPVWCEYFRAELCRFLCARQGGGEALDAVPEEELRAAAEVGYVGQARASAGAKGAGCALKRRNLPPLPGGR